MVGHAGIGSIRRSSVFAVSRALRRRPLNPRCAPAATHYWWPADRAPPSVRTRVPPHRERPRLHRLPDGGDALGRPVVLRGALASDGGDTRRLRPTARGGIALRQVPRGNFCSRCQCPETRPIHRVAATGPTTARTRSVSAGTKANVFDRPNAERHG